MKKFEHLNFEKMNGLIPTMIQDSKTLQILMLGYMNQEALDQTLSTKKVTFYSRSKQRLWVKGETSGHFLELVDIFADCDQDSLLILANPQGSCCHLNTPSCFNTEQHLGLGLLAKLEQRIEQRFQERPQNSYTTELFNSGIARIAQKVGEEGVEVALASALGQREETISEVADLLFHLLVLLKQCEIDVNSVLLKLQRRYE